ncbi:MAG: sigma-54 interaction domain-containing protein [Thermoguttaceae bacterium]
MAVIFDEVPPSDEYRTTLIDIWREACRRIEIGQSTRTVAGILAKQIPLGQLLVRRIDRNRSCLDTVAVGVPAPEYLLPEARSQCEEGQLTEVLAWCRNGKILGRATDLATNRVLATIVPPDIAGDVLAGPLGAPDNPAGVLILIAQPQERFDASCACLAEALLEPFSTALENDQWRHELAAMRAAAEADKQSLLKRLGRKELTDTIVGADSGLQHVIERVELVARSDAPVLILGETGTGKEVIARMIHARSPQSSGPFLRVNCGAIPPELIDSQLFGHEKGAFTGAVESRQGWFERADGGTLLLDEAGELPLAAQVRLLRILQDGWLERVGGHEPVHVNVRIIAATHRDLAAMVADGQFREDLWYRIAVFPVRLPPLRERPEDIPALARHFAERAATRFVLPSAPLTPEDIHLLVSYPWPGNIRELAAVIDRAAILGDGKRLEVAQALGATVKPATALPAAGAVEAAAAPQRPAEVLSLDDAMRRHIESVLTITNGRIEGRRGTAALLKINPHTLRARMRKLKIDWAKYRVDTDG